MTCDDRPFVPPRGLRLRRDDPAGSVRCWGVVLVLVSALGWTAADGRAHGINATYAQLTVEESRVHAAFLLSSEEIVRHFPAADAYGEAIPLAFRFLAEHVRLSVDDTPVALEPGSARDVAAGTFIRFELARSLDRRPHTLALVADNEFFERFGPEQVLLVSLSVENRGQEAVVTRDRPGAAFTTGYRPVLAQCAEFLQLGIAHIFVGYDHLMFLVAVVILGGTLRHLVKVVTAFTVAHSVTLALAAFQVVALPPQLIEGGIALTIAYVAFDNFFSTTTAHRWLLTFVFGLVHGFGFANALAEMQLPPSALVPALLSFNIGVEIGQVLFVAALLPGMLWLARQRFRYSVVMASSAVIFLFGIGWFIQRAFNLSFMPF